MAGTKRTKKGKEEHEGLGRWTTPLKSRGNFKNSYRSADLSDPNFDFLFKKPRVRCSFCKKILAKEKFFYKMSKARTQESVLLYGDLRVAPETFYMCVRCWHDKGLTSVQRIGYETAKA